MNKLNLLLLVSIILILLTTPREGATYYTHNIIKCDTVYKIDTIRDTVLLKILDTVPAKQVKSIKDPSKLEFIKKAITIAVAAEQMGGAPAEIVVAGAIFESGYGTSNLAKMANNYCGHMFTKSQLSRQGVIGKYGNWTKFADMESSLTNHSKLLSNVYNIKSLKDINNICPLIDPDSCRKGLYIQKLLSTIEMWDLKNKCNDARKLLL